MEINIKQISSLHKVRKADSFDFAEIQNKTVLAGERLSYQICFKTTGSVFVTVSMESELAEHVRIYSVKDAVMDTPVTVDIPIEDYITHEPGLMPDILIPIEETNGWTSADKYNHSLWVKVDIPKDIKPGRYSVRVKLHFSDLNGKHVAESMKEMNIDAISAVIPEQQLIYTRWMYLDCIANAHKVEIFSEKHWELIEKYIAAAADIGINMMMVPVHTPPLDTKIGTTRPCVQLVDIEKCGDVYTFGFERFHRYIAICKKCGIQYFEIAHMFSQWGAKYAPNIMITENNKKGYKFGWNTSSDDPEYISFLQQYIAAICRKLEQEGISDNSYFHISDEPRVDRIEAYKMMTQTIRPLIGNCKIFDALSDYAFYEQGLVECPVTEIDHIQKFLEHKIDNQWAYYCCLPQSIYPNSLMAMPSYRVRILGFLLYKYNIKGFLNWGFNFYNACCSSYTIDPYMTTSGDGAYPSGDPFIVYPGENCVYSSIRGEVTYEAVQDMDICFALEKIIGRDAVVEMIDEAAGVELRFDQYPRNAEFIENLRQRIISKIEGQ